MLNHIYVSYCRSSIEVTLDPSYYLPKMYMPVPCESLIKGMADSLATWQRGCTCLRKKLVKIFFLDCQLAFRYLIACHM